MSSYLPPTNLIQPIFNPINFPNANDLLNIIQADARYLIKTGNDTDYGNLTLRNNLYLSDGTSANPSLRFSNEVLGFYRAGSGDIRLSQFGNDVLTYSGAQFLVNGRQRTTISGTASNPSIKIGIDDTNMTGFFNNGIYALTASVGQTTIADFRYTGSSQGIRLYGNTSGNNALYSPSILGYYEERTESMQFQFSGSGITPAGNVKFVRIGQLVVMSIPQYAEITNNSGGARQYASTATIPLRFQPPSLIMSTLIGVLNGGNTNTLSCYINAGTIYIERLTALFSNTDRFYPYSFTISWMLA